MKLVITIVLLTLTRFNSSSAQIKLSQIDDAVQGKQFSLKCKTTTLIKTVSFQSPDGAIAGSCVLPNGVCNSGLVGYQLNQSIATLETIITVLNANRSIHQGTWKCVYSTQQDLLPVIILTLPTNIVFKGLETDIQIKEYPLERLSLMCSCNCAYPEATFGFAIVDKNNNSIIKTYNATGEHDTSYICSDTMEKTYITHFVLNLLNEMSILEEKFVYLKCSVYVRYMIHSVPLTSVSSGTITFPGYGRTSFSTSSPSSSNQDNGGIIAGGVIGGLFGVAILVALVFFVILIYRRRKDNTNHQTASAKTNESPEQIVDGNRGFDPNTSVVRYEHPHGSSTIPFGSLNFPRENIKEIVQETETKPDGTMFSRKIMRLRSRKS